MHTAKFEPVQFDLLDANETVKASSVEAWLSTHSKHFILLRDGEGAHEVLPSDILETGDRRFIVSSAKANCALADWPHHDIEAEEVPPGDAAAVSDEIAEADERGALYSIMRHIWVGSEALWPPYNLRSYADRAMAVQTFRLLKRTVVGEARFRNRRATKCQLVLQYGKTIIDSFEQPVRRG